MKLTFQKASGTKDIKAIFEHTIDAFSESPDFKWALDDLKREVKEGWQLFAVYLEKEIIAAVFFKVHGKELLTKNTATKLEYQGSGYSHQIKSFFEDQAKRHKVKKIIHYCRIDNFRMYSLNENHGYRKTDTQLDQERQLVEWVKDID